MGEVLCAQCDKPIAPEPRWPGRWYHLGDWQPRHIAKPKRVDLTAATFVQAMPGSTNVVLVPSCREETPVEAHARGLAEGRRAFAAEVVAILEREADAVLQRGHGRASDNSLERGTIQRMAARVRAMGEEKR